jgi:site-specific DNA-methyltransferase (adenine-specific)
MTPTWIHEKLSLYHADCMEIMRQFPDKHFDLAIVDPPYGRCEDGGKDRSGGVKQRNGKVLHCHDGGYVAKKWDRRPPEADYFLELLRVSKNQIVWGINYYAVSWPGGRIIWDKVNDGSDQSGAEIAFCSLNERVDIVRYMWRGMMQGMSIAQGTIQQGNKALNEKRIHPTQKPIKLYEWILASYAQPGQRILDTHLGSGSHAIAAHYAGMDFTGIELDADYFKAACERIERETSQMTLSL